MTGEIPIPTASSLGLESPREELARLNRKHLNLCQDWHYTKHERNQIKISMKYLRRQIARERQLAKERR
jgi:hypothetical protein